MKSTESEGFHDEKRGWLQRNMRPIIGMTTVWGCLGLYYLIIAHIVHGKCSPEQKDLLLIILGALPGILSYVLQFNFGGSQDRKQQTK